MRLINADAMLERNKNSIYDTTDLEEILKYEPTAYDVDKVIEGLDNLVPYHTTAGDFVSKADVIRLVRGGGIA